jgi:Ca-activated chloride channel family protein
MTVRFRHLLVVLGCLAVTRGETWAQTVIIDPIPDVDLRRVTPLPPIRPDPRPIPPIPRPRPPRPPRRGVALDVKQHAVQVSITDGVAVTSIDQIFVNPYHRPVEGTYIFPLAEDVAVSQFSMFINGKEIEGKLLGVEEARRIYESIVARMRDPALLEYVGTRMFQARIFPINSAGEARVRLSYTQMLQTEEGLVRYRYPLDTEKHLAAPVGMVSVVADIKSRVPIKSVFSSSHKIAVNAKSENHVTASFEATHLYPDRDFDLYYALGDKEFGLTVLTYREADAEGFFLARIAPPFKKAATEVLPKDICFVIDTSGSMAGEKMEQARTALKFCLSNLNSEDRFNVIPFSHEPLRFKTCLVEASKEVIEEGRKFADGMKATGGTNINDALLTALEAAPAAEASRPYLIVFLTDGLPTIGETDMENILKNVSGRNTGRVRLFVFGVGHDVNTHLLDLLAEQNRGARDYVEPGEDLELKLSSFYRKVADPVLADLALSFGGVNVYDVFPSKLGDLFSGTELVVTGRYSGSGPRAVVLTGKRRDKEEKFIYETTFPKEHHEHEFLPRLWATRKIGFLLDHIRLHGENKELKDTVVELAVKYGIVTPYTSFLVTESEEMVRNPRLRRHAFTPPSFNGGSGRGGGSAIPARPSAPRDGMRTRAKRGAGAVAASKEAAALQSSFDTRGPEALDLDGDGFAHERAVQYVGQRTFYLVDGKWIDAAYEESVETIKIELFSPEYFDLVREHEELARCFALGDRVVVVAGDKVYETVPPPEE